MESLFVHIPIGLPFGARQEQPGVEQRLVSAITSIPFSIAEHELRSCRKSK